jgi:hypothetical protein
MGVGVAVAVALALAFAMRLSFTVPSHAIAKTESAVIDMSPVILRVILL